MWGGKKIYGTPDRSSTPTAAAAAGLGRTCIIRRRCRWYPSRREVEHRPSWLGNIVGAAAEEATDEKEEEEEEEKEEEEGATV